MVYGEDIIRRKLRDSAATRLDNGDYVPGRTTWSSDIRCDAQPAQGKSTVIVMLPDGKSIHYTYEVTLDVAEEPFEYGEEVQLVKSGQPTQTLRVLGYHRYKFNSKIWL